MKVTNRDNPVRESWLADQGLRLDASPYLSGAYNARKLLDRIREKQPLRELTQDGDGIFHAGRVLRRWVTDPAYGVPFLSSTDIMEADFSLLPLVAQGTVDENPRLRIERDWVLITRSGTIGRMAYARPDIDGFACSEHVLRVVADKSRILPGYLYTYLRSQFGLPLITGAAYGAIIQHIEPHHITDLPVPRLGVDLETRIHDLVEEAATLRAHFQGGVITATKDLFTSAGLSEMLDLRWHQQERDVGFHVSKVDAVSLRALNFAPRSRRILDALRSVPHRTLGEVCADGQLSRGDRFKRVDSDPEYGIRLVGQRQGFWLRPEGRWISLSSAALADVRAADETVAVAARGTLGENEVYCRALLITGSWMRFAYSEDFLRIVSGDSAYPGAYLFAFLRSEAMFRVLRSMSTGSKQQDIHEGLRREIPVPECTPTDRARIAETVRRAYRDRDRADELEDQALALLVEAVREASG